MMEEKSSTGDPEIPGGGTSNISDAPQADDSALDTRAYGENMDSGSSGGANSITETVKGDPEIPGGGTKTSSGSGG